MEAQNIMKNRFVLSPFHVRQLCSYLLINGSIAQHSIAMKAYGVNLCPHTQPRSKANKSTYLLLPHDTGEIFIFITHTHTHKHIHTDDHH